MTDPLKESYPIDNIHEYASQIKRLTGDIALSNHSAHQQELANEDPQNLGNESPHERYLSDLHKKMGVLHPADLAYILEALPLADRKIAWDGVKIDCKGKILIASSEVIRETLLANMSSDELREAAKQLNCNEIASLSIYFQQAEMRDIFKSLTIEGREQLRAAMSYSRDSVGAHMEFNVVTIRKESTVESVLRFLRRQNNLPDNIDQLFIVDRDNIFIGVLPLSKLLVSEPEVNVSTLMHANSLSFCSDDKVQQASQLFERYHLVSVPVLDEDNKLLGRLTVNAVNDFTHNKSEMNCLNLVGLHGEEDIFDSVWKSVKNRWLWLSLNLCIAFFASRVISGYEDTIEKLVALAALMPIVVIVSVHSGNQTVCIISRSLARGQKHDGVIQRLLLKELVISLLNGLVWGGIAGGFAYLLYASALLGIVIASAMLLNLFLATLIGMFIPLALNKLGRDPHVGSNFWLAAFTTSSGFFIFLWLANIFLVN